ncbi:MAG: sulfate reduction electron transfer complex DsrMKJOP subunit DsrJ [Candidatus Sumerlaeia bacterium]|nr:sulfate reduction electron transfer complex DsrMKJOP subunit DsrJ [Candidatus Sumerlaeia bacterium]
MRLYNGMVIVPGLLIFLAAVTFPFWIGKVRAGEIKTFQSRPAPAGITCVLPKKQMREQHMALLKQWRDQVVREGDHTPVKLVNGQTMELSLTNGCMKCHAKEDCGPYRAHATYCVDCHDYVGIRVDCWTCHIDPMPQIMEKK